MADAPSSPSPLPLRFKLTSDLHPTSSSTRSQAPPSAIEFIARPRCFNLGHAASDDARAAAPTSPTPLLPRCIVVRFLQDGSEGANHASPGSVSEHPRRSMYSRSGVPTGSASASSAPQAGPISFPLRIKCVNKGVFPRRSAVAMSDRPSAVISLLDKFSVVSDRGNALASAAAPPSPMWQCARVNEESAAQEAKPTANASAPASPNGFLDKSRVCKFGQDDVKSPTTPAATEPISSPLAWSRASDCAHEDNPRAMEGHLSPIQHSRTVNFDTLPQRGDAPSDLLRTST
eukprot:30294-Pelagococcus_subviridis.AAC.29